MKYLFFVILGLCVFNANAENVAQNEPKRLNSFHSLNELEEYLNNKKTECLDKSFGGSRAVACFVSYSEAWDYELNYYYKLLRSELNIEEKDILKKAQLSWIDHRETTIDFNSKLLDRKYADKRGTMYIAMRAGDVSTAIAPLIKSRALLIKEWYESIVKDD